MEQGLHVASKLPHVAQAVFLLSCLQSGVKGEEGSGCSRSISEVLAQLRSRQDMMAQQAANLLDRLLVVRREGT